MYTPLFSQLEITLFTHAIRVFCVLYPNLYTSKKINGVAYPFTVFFWVYFGTSAFMRGVVCLILKVLFLFFVNNAPYHVDLKECHKSFIKKLMHF